MEQPSQKIVPYYLHAGIPFSVLKNPAAHKNIRFFVIPEWNEEGVLWRDSRRHLVSSRRRMMTVEKHLHVPRGLPKIKIVTK